MARKLILLALAGAIGTLARYGLAGFVQRSISSEFPWGTAAVNITGCFLAGLLWALFEGRVSVSGETRIILLMGFMGSFTTFSTFMLETGALAQNTEWSRALGNMIFQNFAGALALLSGVIAVRLL